MGKDGARLRRTKLASFCVRALLVGPAHDSRAGFSSSARAAPWETLFQPGALVRYGSLEITAQTRALGRARADRGATVRGAVPLATLRVPLARGQRTPKDIQGLRSQVWRFSGRFTWRGSRGRLTMDRLRVRTDDRRIVARVGSRTITVGTVSRAWLTNALVTTRGAGYWPAASGGPISLSRAFRDLFGTRVGQRPERHVRGRIRLRMPYRQPQGGIDTNQAGFSVPTWNYLARAMSTFRVCDPAQLGPDVCPRQLARWSSTDPALPELANGGM